MSIVKIRVQIMFEQEIFTQLTTLQVETKSKNLSQAVNWYFTYAAEQLEKVLLDKRRLEYKLIDLEKEVKGLKELLNETR